MSLDGIAMRALAQDLKTKLSGGRIDKISQPSATTMTMGVRARWSQPQMLRHDQSSKCARIAHAKKL